MSTKKGNTRNLMITLPLPLYFVVETLSQRLGASKSKIIQQAIIQMHDSFKEVFPDEVDKDVSGKMSQR